MHRRLRSAWSMLRGLSDTNIPRARALLDHRFISLSSSISIRTPLFPPGNKFEARGLCGAGLAKRALTPSAFAQVRGERHDHFACARPCAPVDILHLRDRRAGSEVGLGLAVPLSSSAWSQLKMHRTPSATHVGRWSLCLSTAPKCSITSQRTLLALSERLDWPATKARLRASAASRDLV
jgi:hypothetical protein